MQICAECGMPVEKATTYHPYAACLMFKACHDSTVVQANLDAVIAHGSEVNVRECLNSGVRESYGQR